MRLLVTGGAGYVGSAVAAYLLEAGHEVVVLDDESTGHADNVPAGADYVRGTIQDAAADVLAEEIDAVLHFAAKSLVAESVANPATYWSNNLGGTLALLEAMRRTGVNSIVFSSTAATYGQPERIPIEEGDPTRPVNPYGASKLAVDVTLTSYASLTGIGAVSLRYFNVAGAYREPGDRWLAERHSPETHLIPNILKIALAVSGDPEAQDAVATAGGAAEVQIFGDDYDTPDGTCIRDYIHVADLAKAHHLALGACEPGEHRIYNLGNGTGYSNREVLAMCREVTGVDIPATMAPRRPGDPATLVASAARIHHDLGWKAKLDLRSMVEDAWAATQATIR
ncbi:MAG TPA: UDP-glucose 4-epimerase GalE [Streptosporangiaceae bacterium]|jgi:UDP-glucose 4-epimerase|nr:UDP-glucose 4-epimerase GalE [Streptosporangiaceae bacterium]